MVIPFSTSLTPEQIEHVKHCLDQGQVLAVPTDSFYALAVSPFHAEGVSRLLQLKGERSQKPIPVLIGELEQLGQLAREVPGIAHKLIQEFWPGLLTIIFSAKFNLPQGLTGGNGTIGVRQPGDDRLCELLRHIGPVTGTSANPSGQPPASHPEEVLNYFGSDIALLLKGGSTPGGAPSTVLQVMGEFRILREGAVSPSLIRQAVGSMILLK